MKKISIVIPIFNEEKNIYPLVERIFSSTQNFKDYNFEVIFVNDGSTDNSETILSDLASENKIIKVIHFTRNFGHQEALWAGLHFAT